MVKRKCALVGIPSPEVSSSFNSSDLSLRIFLLKNDKENNNLLLENWYSLLRRFWEIYLTAIDQPSTLDVVIQKWKDRDEFPTHFCSTLILAVHHCPNLKVISILNQASASLKSNMWYRLTLLGNFCMIAATQGEVILGLQPTAQVSTIFL